MPSIALTLSVRGQLLSGTRIFSPIGLFAANEPGVWYDPSDLTTMFQDTAGTQPVTTPGQTVALALDKSKGLALGAELVTNGDFASGSTGYVEVLGGTISYASQTMLATATTGNTGVYRDVTVVANKSYQVAWRQVSGTNLRMNIYDGASFGTSLYNNGTGDTIVGNRAAVLRPSSTTLRIYAHTPTGSTAEFDNISVRELPGFHATQATTASRPTYGIVPLGGRRNLLTWSEDYPNAEWVKNTTTSSGTTVTFAGGGSNLNQTVVFGVSAGQAVTFSFEARSGTVSTLNFGINGRTNVANNFAQGVVQTLTSTWTRYSATFTAVGSDTGLFAIFGFNGFASQAVGSIELRNAQFELGPTATAYQRVGTAFDVTEAGVASLSYLSFDGVDDFLVTPTITPGIDKAQVFAGVRKIADTNSGVIVDNITGSTDGQFQLLSGFSVAGRYAFVSKGSVQIVVEGSGYTSPITNVLTGLGDISGDRTTLRVNGIQAAQSTSDQGAGNYLAYLLCIGRRGDTMFPLNGQIYSLIVRFGANLDAGTITSTETWVNGKTGAYA